MKVRLIVSLAALVVALPMSATVYSSSANPGQKVDSGLGSLPHYSLWKDKSGRNPMGNAVIGESLDDGLGSLPHYSQWKDKSGRDPMGLEAARLASR